jgi:hypothetical protein
MTHSNTPARQQGDNLIRRKVYYEDYSKVQRIVQQLEEQGAFRHQSRRATDEDGTFVVVSYVDSMVVSTGQTRRPSTDLVPIQRPRQLALPQRPVRQVVPVHRRWWFVPSIVVGFLSMVCGGLYWVFQQMKKMDAPDIGVGVLGFLFVVVLAVWLIKNIGGGSGSGHSGRSGFHYTPCD